MPLLDIGDLPPELTANPAAYVSVTGLDVDSNPIHRTIWDSFIATRQDRVPLFLKLLPIGKEFPKAKPKVICYRNFSMCVMSVLSKINISICVILTLLQKSISLL